MSNFKGTKGKWEIKHSESKDAFNICGTLVGGKYKIARIPYLVTKSSIKLTEKDKKNAQYDAQLIAHAPEMLEMLEKSLQFIDYKENFIFYNEIEQLIKKATDI